MSNIKYVTIAVDLTEFDTDALIEELENRGHTVDGPTYSDYMSDYSDSDLVEELECRGYNISDAPTDDNISINKCVQFIRTGQIRVSGSHANLLLGFLYDKTNKIV